MPNSNQKTVNTKTDEFAIEIKSERYSAVAPVGWHILFDPKLKPRQGNVVLVSFDNESKCCLMFYLVMGDHVYLNPVEDRLKLIELIPNLNATIEAVGTETIFYESTPIRNRPIDSTQKVS